MKKWFNRFEKFEQFLEQPWKVILVCGGLLICCLVLNGSMVQLYRLQRALTSAEQQITELTLAKNSWQKKLRQTRDPQFIENEARQRFDFVQKDELVFVFDEE